MASALVHRGPDDDGVWVEPELGRRARVPPALDHRPHAGRCPADGLGRRALRAGVQRRDLQPRTTLRARARGARGAAFRGHSDTEVLLAAIGALGRRRPCARALERHVRLRALGPRASARSTWRATASARSRSTTAWSGGALVFASELKALRRRTRLRGRGRPRRARACSPHGYVPAPVVDLSRALRSCPPALASTIRAGRTARAAPRPVAYWSAADAVAAGAAVSCGRRRRGCRPARRAAARRGRLRMVADVPLGRVPLRRHRLAPRSSR